MVRDNSKGTLDLFERNLAKRQGANRSVNKKVEGSPVQKTGSPSPTKETDYLLKNMNPSSRLLKINKSTKEYVKDQYADYNRYSDPHLKNYLMRKSLIASKGKDNLNRGLYYAS